MTSQPTEESSTPRLWDNKDLLGLRSRLTQMGASSILVVLGSRSVAALELEPILEDALVSFKYSCVSEVGSGSPVSSVLDVVEAIRDLEPDTVLAVGGGSVIDTAKAASVLAALKERPVEADVEARWSSWPARVERRVAALVAVPTTAGTGTEGTPYSVLTSASGTKLFGFNAHFQPSLAVLVPEFVTTVPKPVIAHLAMDAMAHAFEAFWSRRACGTSDFAAETALTLLDSHLHAYYSCSTNLTAARAILLAASQAGEAFRLALSTACHAMSFPIAAILGDSHGHACSLLLALVARENLRDAATLCKLDGLARTLGRRSGHEIPGYIEEWRATLGLNQPIAERLDISRQLESPALQRMMDSNPVQLRGTDVDRVLQRLTMA